MALKKGMDEVRASLKRSQSRGNNSGSDTNWFGWGDGESKILRFLTDSDDIIIAPVHEGVPTHDGKKKTFVCREAFDANCELCGRQLGSESKPLVYKRDLGYGVAVLREQAYREVEGKRVPAKDENGKNIIKDVVIDYEKEEGGQKVSAKKPFVGIVSQGLRNFWGTISLLSQRDPLRTFDIEIVREGKGVDTRYAAIPFEPKLIDKMEKYDPFLPVVTGFLERIGSQEYYDIHLHGVKPKDTAEPFETSEYEEEETSIALDEETMADRLKKKL